MRIEKNSRRHLSSARFLIENEDGEVIAEADTYEEAQSVGGATVIDTKKIKSSRKPIKSSNKYEFEISEMDGYAEYPMFMTDAWGHEFDISGLDKPYATYEEWEEDVTEAIDDPEFVEGNADYLNELYDYQDRLCNKYYGTDLIANSYDRLSSSRTSQSSGGYLKEIIRNSRSEDEAVDRIVSHDKCNVGYARALYNRYVSSGVMEINDDLDQEFDVDGDLTTWFRDYVSEDGMSSTVGGELVRAASRIIDSYDSKGDKIGFGYGKETCNPAARYIVEVASDYEGVKDIQKLLDEEDINIDYDAFIADFESSFTDYLRDNGELFHAVNKDDMMDYRQEDDRDSSVDECYVTVDGVKYVFENDGDSWYCSSFEPSDKSVLNEDDVFDDGHSLADKVDDRTSDYVEFDDDGFNYSVESYGDPDEDGEYHEWIVTSVLPDRLEWNEGDAVDVDDIIKYDVFSPGGRKLDEHDLM